MTTKRAEDRSAVVRGRLSRAAYGVRRVVHGIAPNAFRPRCGDLGEAHGGCDATALCRLEHRQAPKRHARVRSRSRVGRRALPVNERAGDECVRVAPRLDTRATSLATRAARSRRGPSGAGRGRGRGALQDGTGPVGKGDVPVRPGRSPGPVRPRLRARPADSRRRWSSRVSSRRSCSASATPNSTCRGIAGSRARRGSA